MEWLEASGRLEGMEAEKYIFTPLAYPGKEARGGKADDWLDRQPLFNAAILASLKLYGRRAGIAEEKLTLMALRRTAIRMRMDQGGNLEGMKVFMDSREESRFIKYRLGWMPEIIDEENVEVENRKNDIEVPVRETKPFKAGENLTHGYYTHKRDMQAVRAVMAENIHGMQQEIACLRSLMNLILEHHGDEAGLVDSYTRAASRLAELIKVAELVKEHKKDSWAYETLDDLDRIAASLGQPPCSQQIRDQAMGLSSSTGHVAVEIASIRLLLRNLYRWAMQEVNPHAYLHLVDLYGSGCVRLAKLLKLGGGDEAGDLERILSEGLAEAIREVHEELLSGWQINSG